MSWYPYYMLLLKHDGNLNKADDHELSLAKKMAGFDSGRSLEKAKQKYKELYPDKEIIV